MWKSTLKLATMWEATAVRDLAINNLTKLDVVDMILLGTEYRVSLWFINGCLKLIHRKHGPTEEECNLLGISFVVQIYGLRERKLSRRTMSHSECLPFMTNLVRETFSDRIVDDSKT